MIRHWPALVIVVVLSLAPSTHSIAAPHPEGPEPQDFETAYRMVREFVNNLRVRNEEIEIAKSFMDPDLDAIKKLEREFERHKHETARLLNLALKLKDSNSKIKEVNIVRHSLVYVYLLQGRLYDSAILGEWVARRYAYDEENDAIASDCAYLAMAAYSRIYRSKGNADRQFDRQRLIRICDLIMTQWPNTPKEFDAQKILETIRPRKKDYEKAVNRF